MPGYALVLALLVAVLLIVQGTRHRDARLWHFTLAVLLLAGTGLAWAFGDSAWLFPLFAFYVAGDAIRDERRQRRAQSTRSELGQVFK